MKKISNLKGAALMIASVMLLAAVVGLVSNKRSSGTEFVFTADNFAVLRQPLILTADTPHGEIAVRHIEFINDNFYNRIPFSYQEMYTARWIVEELLAIGYTWECIEIQEFYMGPVYIYIFSRESQDIEWQIDFLGFSNNTPFFDLGTRTSRLSQNIILTVSGQSDKAIVVGAHYDSVFVSGASDNASGVALLLESAQRMFEIDNYHTIVYVFFGAEELGLWGSRYFVRSLSEQEHENILFMINADVLLEGQNLFYKAGYYRNGESGANHITEIWDRIAGDMYLQHGLNFIPWPSGIFIGSDHEPFLRDDHRHTVMFLSGMEAIEGWYNYDPENIHRSLVSMSRVWHSSRDDFHYINRVWPGKIDYNMRAFSLFLEALLLAEYPKAVEYEN